MTTLEKIRAEIAQLQDEWFKETDGWWCYEKALQIIDKYAEQEPKICKKCLYADETDGSHCYKCVKGESKFEPQESEESE